VTLPLVAPGIAAAALLAFSLSFDDFIITNFNSGTLTTFPKFVYVSAARGIPAQANVIGSAMFFLALAIVIAGQLISKKTKVSK
jgi:spermidine/putrescine transport system permease protein